MGKFSELDLELWQEEDLEDVFEEYTERCELVRVKTTNMGSMFRLTYNVVMKNCEREKEMIDRLRERNGNLEILISRQETHTAEL